MWIECSRCHSRNPIAADICGECGNALAVGSEGLSVGATSFQDEAGSSVTGPINGNGKRTYPALIRYALLAGVFIGVIVLLWIVIGRRDPENRVPSPTPESQMVALASPTAALPAVQSATRSPVVHSRPTSTEVSHELWTPTLTPTPEVIAVPSLTATLTATATIAPTATPTAIATIAPTATKPPTVQGLFVKVWQRYQSRLGAPLQGNTSDRYFQPYTFGEMAFEGGHMFFYAGPPKRIWVVYGSRRGGWTGKGTWGQYPETWQEGDPEYSCAQEAEYPRQPKWGFGKVWCNYSEVRAGLNWGLEGARDIERESPGHSIYRLQQFEHGFIFRDSDGWTNQLAYVFFDDGSVVRESYR